MSQFAPTGEHDSGAGGVEDLGDAIADPGTRYRAPSDLSNPAADMLFDGRPGRLFVHVVASGAHGCHHVRDVAWL